MENILFIRKEMSLEITALYLTKLNLVNYQQPIALLILGDTICLMMVCLC